MLSLANIIQINLIKKQSYSHLKAFTRHMYYINIQMHMTEHPDIMAPKIIILLNKKSRNRQCQLALALQLHSAKVNIFAIPLASLSHLQNGTTALFYFHSRKTNFISLFYKESINFPIQLYNSHNPQDMSISVSWTKKKKKVMWPSHMAK